MSNTLRKSKENNPNVEHLHLGRWEGIKPEKRKLAEQHVGECGMCSHQSSLRLLICMKGKTWIGDDGYFRIEWKKETYNIPLPKKLFKEVGKDVNKLYEKGLEIMEEGFDYAMFNVIAKGKGNITKAEWSWLEKLNKYYCGLSQTKENHDRKN